MSLTLVVDKRLNNDKLVHFFTRNNDNLQYFSPENNDKPVLGFAQA